MILKTENDLAFQDLFQSLTSEVTTEEYVAFGGDVETHKDVRRLQRIRMSEIAHDDWSEKVPARCIEDVTSDLWENHMEFDNEWNGEEIEKVLVGQPKPAKVLHILQMIKILAITWDTAVTLELN